VRIYSDLDEAVSEVERDLKELAIIYQSTSVQDQDTSQNQGFLTHELMNYQYTISPLTTEDIYLQSPPDVSVWRYIRKEFDERTSGLPLNPGSAWTEDEAYWSTFLDSAGEFAYTYAERMWRLNKDVIEVLNGDPATRRAYLSIWNPDDTLLSMQGQDYKRVPCSLGYHFMIRKNQLHMHYVMRSCDFVKHFRKDVILALLYMGWVRDGLDIEYQPGSFTHTIFSLHAFAKDLEGVF